MTDGSADDVPARDLETEQAQRSSVAPGVLAFLIADVRGYTSFTQEHGDEEAGRLAAAFAELARETVVASGGELIELRGDEALCAFGSARQAVRAAVELQMAFRRPRGDGSSFPLPIGVGLDAGEAVPIEGGYRGGALNTAARLCSIARPGEILATDTVVSLARRLDGIRYIPRRPVRLKGLDSPVRVIEVVPQAALPPLPVAAPKKRPWGTRRRIAAAAVAAGVLVAAIVGFFLARSSGSARAGVDANAVGVIDAESAGISSQVKLESAPSAITAGGGSVWVANQAAGTISRLDPDSNAIQTLSLRGRPGGIAYGAGSVWVTNSEARSLVQINARTSAVVQTFTVGNAPGAVAVGKDSVWTANIVDGTVSRLDLSSGSVTDPIAVGPNPAGIAVGSGAVWVTVESTGSVVRIDPASHEVVQTTNVGNGPTGIAAGAGGVWVANTRDGTVSRIDPATNSVSAVVAVGPNPSTIAADGDGVWVGNAGRDTITRIDPATAEIVKTLSLGSRPSGIALAGDKLYTTTVVPLAGHRGGVLRIESDPSACRCVDPVSALGANVTDFAVSDLVYDGLVAYRRVGGSAGGQLVPNLAERLPTSTDDGKTYSVHLRSGVRYSDGTPLRASDFRASVERDVAVNPATTFGGIVGAAHCLARSGDPCELSRGIAVDNAKRTIVIRLTRPDANFVFKLALPEAGVLPAGKAPRTHAHSIPGTGPYRVLSFHPNREIRLVRNVRFHVWSPDARPDGYPDEIRFRLSRDAAAKLRAVETGAADWVQLVDPSLSGAQQRGVLTRYADLLHSDAKPGTFWEFLNTRTPPFDDVRVRRALNYAIDRKALVGMSGGLVSATCQILPPSFPGYRPYCPYTRNPSPAGAWTAPDLQKARSLVRASGTAGMPVRIIAVEQSAGLAVARYFVSVLRQLGYRASVRTVGGDRFVAYIADSRSRTQTAPTGWFADSLAASNFLELFTCSSFAPHSPQNLNLFEYCDRRLDAKIQKAAALQVSDPARASELSAEVDRAVVDQALAVPWANAPNRVLVSRRVGNYQSHPLWGTLLDQLWVR